MDGTWKLQEILIYWCNIFIVRNWIYFYPLHNNKSSTFQQKYLHFYVYYKNIWIITDRIININVPPRTKRTHTKSSQTLIINHFQYEYPLLDIYKTPQDFNYTLRKPFPIFPIQIANLTGKVPTNFSHDVHMLIRPSYS